jgi:hypothetical protein
MTADYLELRFQSMRRRLTEVYESLGQSSGRPYIYFVYPPAEELRVRSLANDYMIDDGDLTFLHIDLLPLTMASLDGQEERRAALLNDQVKSQGADKSILRRWAQQLANEMDRGIKELAGSGRPVVVLCGLAALYPLGNPTALMEAAAERELHDPRTGKVVPIVLLIPGVNPPQTSRTYLFLGLEDQLLSFYRGEEM